MTSRVAVLAFTGGMGVILVIAALCFVCDILFRPILAHRRQEAIAEEQLRMLTQYASDIRLFFQRSTRHLPAYYSVIEEMIEGSYKSHASSLAFKLLKLLFVHSTSVNFAYDVSAKNKVIFNNERQNRHP